MNVQYNFSLNALHSMSIHTFRRRKKGSFPVRPWNISLWFISNRENTQQKAALFMMNISTAKLFLYGFLRFTKRVYLQDKAYRAIMPGTNVVNRCLLHDFNAERVTTPLDLKSYLSKLSVEVTLCGHEHLPTLQSFL